MLILLLFLFSLITINFSLMIINVSLKGYFIVQQKTRLDRYYKKSVQWFSNQYFTFSENYTYSDLILYIETLVTHDILNKKKTKLAGERKKCEKDMAYKTSMWLSRRGIWENINKLWTTFLFFSWSSWSFFPQALRTYCSYYYFLFHF